MNFRQLDLNLLRVLADLQVRVRGATLDSVRSGGTSAQLGAPLATEQLVRLLECLQEGDVVAQKVL